MIEFKIVDWMKELGLDEEGQRRFALLNEFLWIRVGGARTEITTLTVFERWCDDTLTRRPQLWWNKIDDWTMRFSSTADFLAFKLRWL